MPGIKELMISEEGGAKSCELLELKAGTGILGNLFTGKNERQVCLLDYSLSKRIKGLGGICTEKFTGNILTDGLDYKLLKTGQKFYAGSALIEITSCAKKCFPYCPLVKAKSPCGLPQNTAFAKVIADGSVRVGDKLSPCA